MSQLDIPDIKCIFLRLTVSQCFKTEVGAMETQADLTVTRGEVKDVHEDVPGGAAWNFMVCHDVGKKRKVFRRAAVSKAYHLNKVSTEFSFPTGISHIYYDAKVHADESLIIEAMKADMLSKLQEHRKMVDALEAKLRSS